MYLSIQFYNKYATFFHPLTLLPLLHNYGGLLTYLLQFHHQLNLRTKTPTGPYVANASP